MATEAQIFDAVLTKFREAYPEGRIAADIKFLDAAGVGVKVSVFKDLGDGTAAASAVASDSTAQAAQVTAALHAFKLIGVE
ncbi:MAG TPA: hypothetical protein VI322_00105 [Candidatus Saccharimonadia bacterium]